MNKKIVVLNGSPRMKGNTVSLIKAFTKGAEEAGNAVICFELQNMDIHGCLGCCKGGKNFNSPCVQKDDMLKIYPAYREADVVVLASPLYYWTVSGQLKCAFDRLFAVAECNENFANPKKDCILLMAAEGHGFDESTYWYDNLMKHMHWNSIGRVLCGGVFEIGDIDNTAEGIEKIEEAYKLGLTI